MEIKDFKRLNEATLRLFKSIYVEEGATERLTEDDLLKLTSKGLLLHANIYFNNRAELESAIESALDIYQVNMFTLSNTFHKTWKTVEEINPALHYLQQVIHYISTYGFDALGIPYDAGNSYIPEEKISYPENTAPYNFTIIRAIDLKNIVERVEVLLSSGVALSQQQVDDVVYLLGFIETKGLSCNFDLVKNKEVKATLWLKLENKPFISVDEFLRVLTYVATENTLLIRSYRNYQMIQMYLKWHESKRIKIKELLEYYISKFGIENIASQFLRNKMLFLSFKCEETKHIINRLRRLADKYHKPKTEPHLLADDIYEANIWQLVKYYNLCQSHLNPTADKLYQIRNGKNYLAENRNYGLTGDVKRVVEEHYSGLKNIIVSEIKKKLAHLEGKIFLVPDYIDYKVPSSLKRLASGVPEGTIITFPEDKKLTVGIHWENKMHKGNELRVDLDLHANSLDKSIGWYSAYKNDEVMYSGDVTDAKICKGGASEAVTFNNIESPYIVTLNDYTQHSKTSYKFIFDLDTVIEEDSYRHEAKGYIFSPNARVLNSTVTQAQNTLGLVMKNRFYFLNSSIFSGPITHGDDLLKRLIKYYEDIQGNDLTFKQLADMIGFTVISSQDELKLEPDENGEYPYVEVLDLSLENITEDTFPSLFTAE